MDPRSTSISGRRLPEWLKKRATPSDKIHQIKGQLRGRGLHTVCEEARCPNIGECFERGTATIMIMGDVCTRRCGFCAVRSGEPAPIDTDEPMRVAAQVREMGLRHAVITSVTRDDLSDGGAGHFAETVREIRKICPETTIEVLTPDFEGRAGDVKIVCDSRPDVFNHNVETVRRLTSYIRDKAGYDRSLDVLRLARGYLRTARIKSGLMLGLGETTGEVEATLSDLRHAGVDIVTIGQYLPPSKDAIPVAEYIPPKTFRELRKLGLKLGFKAVFSGPFVRSSYLADKALV